MGRIRTIKPALGRHEGLFDLEQETGLPIRFAWAMLPTVCDREGRFVWRPRELKVEILPHDPIDFSRVLDAWLTRGYLVKYRVGHAWYGWVPTFLKHQFINHREEKSILPGVDEAEEAIDHRNQPLGRVDDASATRDARGPGTPGGKGKEGKGKEGVLSGAETRPPRVDGHSKIVLTFPCNGKPEAYALTEERLDEWTPLYLGLDVLGECRKALAWLHANPRKKKTAGGMPRFLLSWLNRANDRPRQAGGPISRPETGRRLVDDDENERTLATLRNLGKGGEA